MKRRSITFIILPVVALFLLMPIFGLLSADAAEADYKWAQLTYTYTVPNDGEGETKSGRVDNEMHFPFTPTVTCHESARLSVNGTGVSGTSAPLEHAGSYEVTVTSKTNGKDSLTYTLYVEPELNIADGDSFAVYPQITCSNAVSMLLDPDLFGVGTAFASGDTVRQLGKHVLRVFGYTAKGNKLQYDYTFYVKACEAVRYYDEESKKQTLDVIVGEFDDLEVAVTLDGNPLQTGHNKITRVGHHQVEVKVNGNVLTNDGVDFGSYSLLHGTDACPTAEALFLRVELIVPSLDTDEPLDLSLGEWDAEFLLDGEPVSGDYRVTADGEHHLTVRDYNGVAVELGVFVGEEKEGEELVYNTCSELVFTFRNPHKTYAIIAAVPAALLLCAAAFFLIARRRVV